MGLLAGTAYRDCDLGLDLSVHALGLLPNHAAGTEVSIKVRVAPTP